MNPHSLINTRPKRNGHVVAVVHFEPRTEDGPCECSCGESMAASEFSAHRRAAGAKPSSRTLGVPDMLRGDPSVWQRTAPKSYCTVTGCDQPVLARGLCNSDYKRWWRGRVAA